jgi:hypothetical protein
LKLRPNAGEQTALTKVFLTDFHCLMRRANFALLSPGEYDARNLGGFLLDLPTTVDVAKMDATFLTAFLDENPMVAHNAMTFGNRALIYYRGTGTTKKHGRFLSAKLELLRDFILGRVPSETAAPGTMRSVYPTIAKLMDGLWNVTEMHEPVCKEVIVVFKRAPAQLHKVEHFDKAVRTYVHQTYT